MTYASYETNLVLRSIASYITRRFRVVPSNRDRAISGVIESLMDATPFTVIRRDIESFYENIDAEALRQRLTYDTSIPRSVRHYLTLFFDAHCPRNQRGVPRGIGLTSVLAELAMERFDREVRAISGVYRYFRYSDDIVIFAYDSASTVESRLATLLPQGMTFNRDKSSTVDFTKNDHGVPKYFEYLGYRISTNSGRGGKSPRIVDVTISSAKIRRLKTRIVLSLKSFKKTKDGDLLIDRLRLLSSNYQVNRHGASNWVRGRRVRSGIFYSYRSSGKYNSSSFNSVTPSSLEEIDSFVHFLLRSKKSEFSSAINSHLNASQMQKLNAISFRLGFSSRRMIRMDYVRLATVKGVWRNA